jgi:hypothetical protein
MKNLLTLSLATVAFLTVCAACSEKKQSNIIIAKKQPIIVKASKPRKMGDYEQSRSVVWLGSKYTVESKLGADSTLPLAYDGPTKYYDNRIQIRVVRADGSVFFTRSFQKSDFKSYVDNYYYENGALLGVVYVKAEGNHLVFAASVGNPDKSSDEYVPMVLKISNLGAVSITKDTQLDTTTDTQPDEEGV